jgi:transposase
LDRVSPQQRGSVFNRFLAPVRQGLVDPSKIVQAVTTEALSQAPVTQPNGTVAVPVPPPPPPRTAQELAHQRQARRLALHQQIWAVHQQGWHGWAIAKQLKSGKNTVFRYLRTATWPARKRRTDRGRSLLTLYTAYLQNPHRNHCELCDRRDP